MDKGKIDFPYEDRYVFPIVMQEEDLCRQLLERLFPERKVQELRLHSYISRITPEKVIAITASGRGVRLDVVFEDSNAVYDIEMQLRNYDDLPKRTRYYHSIMDSYSLKHGDDFSKLKPQYVIFICNFDPFNKGQALYSFQMMDTKIGLSLGEETFTIFLNTKADEELIPKELKSFCRYISRGVPDDEDEFVRRIHEQVVRVNQDPDWRIVLMTLREEFRIMYKDELDEARAKAAAEGLAEGKAQGLAEGLAEGKAQGLAEGLAEGKAQGLAEGRAERDLEIIRNGKADGLSAELLANLTGLTVEEIEAI